jgi:DNA repair protein RecN (Recombination protein N)
MSAAAGVDQALDALGERIAALALELDDVAGELRSYLDSLDADPAALDAAEERLAEADRLKRKHGGTIEAVLDHAERCRAEIERLANADELAAELDARIERTHGRRAAFAAKLTAGRKRAAKKLTSEVERTLGELAMEGAKLEVRLEAHAEGLGASGAERVELLLATNPGMPLSPLRDAASGGELSRVMLALGGLGAAGARTTVFDEIDAGVGGTTARAVGERLRSLGERGQVICITHLPQVASLANAHFRLVKRVEDGATLATVDRVEGESLVAEICRMLGADAGDKVAARHARELLAA